MANEDSWTKRLQVIGQWVLILIAILAGWRTLDNRITILETQINQEQAGYNIAMENLTKRLDRMENKIDVLIEKAHRHN